MMTLYRILLCLVLLSAGSGYALASGGARIVLKDGTSEETERYWESERFIHFILKGTRSVEIRYARTIVERIEPLESIPLSSEATDAGQVLQPQTAPMKPLNQTGVREARETAGNEPAPSTPHPPMDPGVVDKHRDVRFFDPQRPQRYWASQGSRHATLDAALEALAAQYRQTKEWVMAHMGQENDLGCIHANLIAGLETGPDTDAVGQEGISSLEAPAREALSIPVSTPVRIDIPLGIHFYDPRRSAKYLSDPSTGHDTLQAALTALAAKYGVSPDWIKRHMGETNVLAEIHGNILEGLQQAGPNRDRNANVSSGTHP